MSVAAVLYLIALLLVVCSFFRSEWPFISVALLLVVIAGLVPVFVR